MKITLLGSLGNINRHFITRLIADGHEVTVITSRPEGAAAIEKLGAKAAVGLNTDLDFLSRTFTGSDLVYLMITGIAFSSATSMSDLAKIYSQAIKKTDVKKVINLSSVGAQSPEAGILYEYHAMEDGLDELTGVTVKHIRPVGFYTNLLTEIALLKAQGKIFEAISPETMRAWVHPSDIADAVYNRINDLLTDKAVSKIKYVVSDWAIGTDWVNALETNNISAQYVTISVEDLVENFVKAGLPKVVADGFGQMNQFQQSPDKLYQEIKSSTYHHGKVKINDFAKEFAQVYYQ